MYLLGLEAEWVTIAEARRTTMFMRTLQERYTTGSIEGGTGAGGRVSASVSTVRGWTEFGVADGESEYDVGRGSVAGGRGSRFEVRMREPERRIK